MFCLTLSNCKILRQTYLFALKNEDILCTKYTSTKCIYLRKNIQPPLITQHNFHFYRLRSVCHGSSYLYGCSRLWFIFHIPSLLSCFMARVSCCITCAQSNIACCCCCPGGCSCRSFLLY